MSRVIHFEIQASEPQALVDFYTALLGWSFTKWEGADYWLIRPAPTTSLASTAVCCRARAEAPLAGQPVNAFVCTAQVTSLDEALTEGSGARGLVALAKMAVPGIGWLAYIKDPDGNIVGLLEPDEGARMES